MKYILFIYLFLTTTNFSIGQSIQALKEEGAVARSFYFYPSTLRMLNIQNDTAFNKLIKNVRKLSFWTMKEEAFNQDSFYNTLEQLERVDNYQLYMELDGPKQQLHVLGKEAAEEMVILALHEGKHYIMDIEGKLDLKQLMTVYENISKSDAALPTGMATIFNTIKKEEQQKQAREKRRKEREAARKEESQENN